MVESKEFIKRDDVRGLYPSQLNGTVAEAIGRASCETLKNSGIVRPLFAVGHDCRRGNIEISQGFMLGVLRAGGDCEDLGLVSTEHVYYSCGKADSKYDAGAMVTASHNPREYNGIKLIHKGCLPFSQDELAFIGRRCDEQLSNPARPLDFNEYARYLLHLAGLDAKDHANPLTVVVLAGGGMGAVAFSPIAKMLEPFGLRSIILEGEPNGEFPDGVPNPLLPNFMARLSKKVVEHKADLGIGFDGDADRAGFVDSDGNEIIPSQVLALISGAKVKAAGRNDRIVMHNICTSQLLRHLFMDTDSAAIIETAVGHGRIKQLMRSPLYRDSTLIAGEHSGHYYYPEFSYADSGVLSSLYMISIVWDMRDKGENLSDTLRLWREKYRWSGEINYEMPSRQATLDAMKKVFDNEKNPEVKLIAIRFDKEAGGQRAFVESCDYDPATAEVPDLKMLHDKKDHGWWFVLRPSGNEPKLRLNVEAWGTGSEKVCNDKAAEINELLLASGAVRK